MDTLCALPSHWVRLTDSSGYRDGLAQNGVQRFRMLGKSCLTYLCRGHIAARENSFPRKLDGIEESLNTLLGVIPEKVGIQSYQSVLDSGVRRNDEAPHLIQLARRHSS
jgi:hypothetical protein